MRTKQGKYRPQTIHFKRMAYFGIPDIRGTENTNEP